MKKVGFSDRYELFFLELFLIKRDFTSCFNKNVGPTYLIEIRVGKIFLFYTYSSVKCGGMHCLMPCMGWLAGLQIEHSMFEPWPMTLSCVFGQDTLLSQCLSPPRYINGYRRI